MDYVVGHAKNGAVILMHSTMVPVTTYRPDHGSRPSCQGLQDRYPCPASQRRRNQRPVAVDHARRLRRTTEGLSRTYHYSTKVRRYVVREPPPFSRRKRHPRSWGRWLSRELLRGAFFVCDGKPSLWTYVRTTQL